MNRRAALWTALAVTAGLLAAPVSAERRRGPRIGPGSANPSALVAAELAFARAAREDGQWTAFRDFAADGAIMFVPQPVLARDWLRGRDNPPAAVQWEPYEVWMSCDGSLGVTRGAWHKPDGSVGYFTTIWERGKKGDYRWILDQGDALASPLDAPDMVSASVADCPVRAGRGDGDRGAGTQRPAEAAMEGSGHSRDGTLAWSYHVDADLGRKLAVMLRKGGQMEQVVSLAVAPPAK